MILTTVARVCREWHKVCGKYLIRGMDHVSENMRLSYVIRARAYNYALKHYREYAEEDVIFDCVFALTGPVSLIEIAGSIMFINARRLLVLMRTTHVYAAVHRAKRAIPMECIICLTEIREQKIIFGKKTIKQKCVCDERICGACVNKNKGKTYCCFSICSCGKVHYTVGDSATCQRCNAISFCSSCMPEIRNGVRTCYSCR